MNKFWLLGFLAISIFGFQTADAQTKITPQARSVMNQFLATFLDLQSFMVSNQKVLSKKERDKVASELKRLARLSVDLRKKHDFESTGFRISAELLTEELQRASSSFTKGNLGYARRSLRSTLDVCSSCHSQVPQSPATPWKFDEKSLQGSSFQRAEFLFSTRQYIPANLLYHDFAKKFNGQQDAVELERALTRILAINIRSVRNPNLARKELNEVANNENYAPSLKQRISDWIKALRALERLSPPDVEKVSAEKLVTFVSKRLDAKESKGFDEADLVKALYFSGLLYQFLNTRPAKDITPELLYWLALYENRLGENYPAELSRLYLKECVLRFPSQDTAKLCFQEYESLQTLEYTGSGGTKIPADIKKDLDTLRAKIQAK
mgnify:CR=1 FL=1